MSAKKLIIELLDPQGQAAAGVPLKASGCDALQSSPLGTSMFLVDAPQVCVEVQGKSAYTSSLDALPAKVTLQQQADGSWKTA